MLIEIWDDEPVLLSQGADDASCLFVSFADASIHHRCGDAIIRGWPVVT
jgi:hypothetical protein